MMPALLMSASRPPKRCTASATRRSGGRKPVRANLVGFAAECRGLPASATGDAGGAGSSVGKCDYDVAAAHLEHLAVPVATVADLVAEAKLRWRCLRCGAFACGGWRPGHRHRLLAVVAAAAGLAGFFREVLAQGADAAAGRLRVVHHLLEPV